jgi:hypothetical protein
MLVVVEGTSGVDICEFLILATRIEVKGGAKPRPVLSVATDALSSLIRRASSGQVLLIQIHTNIFEKAIL